MYAFNDEKIEPVSLVWCVIDVLFSKFTNATIDKVRAIKSIHTFKNKIVLNYYLV